MLTPQVGSCKRMMPVQAVTWQLDQASPRTAVLGGKELVLHHHQCMWRCLQSATFFGLGSKSAESMYASASTDQIVGTGTVSASDIRTVLERNSALRDSFRDHAADTNSAMEKAIIGIHTLEAAKADGTEASMKRAIQLVTSLGCRRQPLKRGRKSQQPMLKDICIGISREIEKREVKRLAKHSRNTKLLGNLAFFPRNPKHAAIPCALESSEESESEIYGSKSETPNHSCESISDSGFSKQAEGCPFDPSDTFGTETRTTPFGECAQEPEHRSSHPSPKVCLEWSHQSVGFTDLELGSPLDSLYGFDMDIQGEPIWFSPNKKSFGSAIHQSNHEGRASWDL